MTSFPGPPVAQQKISRNTLAHVLMLAMVLVWGTMFVIVKKALVYIPPQWLNSLRMTLGFLCLAVVYSKHLRRVSKAAWLIGAAAGAAMSCGFFFQTQGLLYTTATNSAFITAMVVVIVPLLASIPGLRSPDRGRPSWTAWAGAILAFSGVALLTTPAHTPWLQLLHNLNRGDLLTLLCSVGFSLQIIVLDRGAQWVGFEQLTILQVGFAMVFLTAGAGLYEPHMFTHLHSLAGLFTKPVVVLAIAATGILATALAFSVQTWAQGIIPATNIAVIVTLEPVVAWMTAFVVLHEGLEIRRALGATFVLLGILAAELLPRGRRTIENSAK